MKILITGARGQVGSEVVRLGISEGYEIDAVDYEDLDISNNSQVAGYFQKNHPDIVINAAAYTAVDKAEEEELLAYSINRDGAGHLASACAKLKIPLIHISTDYVFDGLKNAAYLETDLPAPQGVYGASKFEGEKLVAQLEKHIILRVAWVFGKQGHNFVKTMLRLGESRDELKIVDDQIGGPTWSVDIAQTLISLVKHYQQNSSPEWGTYHFTGQPELTWYRFSKEIFNQAKRFGVLKKIPFILPIKSEEYPTAAVRPQNSALNCQKIKRVFDIKQPDWHTGLEQVVKNWKSS